MFFVGFDMVVFGVVDILMFGVGDWVSVFVVVINMVVYDGVMVKFIGFVMFDVVDDDGVNFI